MTLGHTALMVCRSLMPNLYCPPAGVLLPSGHIVTDTAPPHVRHLYTVPSISKFRSDLDCLCRQYRPLPISDLEQLPRRRENRTSPSDFVLSFDDGMREVYEIIAPMLRAKGIPAIFFINSATIDNKQLMWRHKVSLLIERSSQQPGRVPPQISVRPGESWLAKLRALRFADEHILDEVARFLEVDFDEYLHTAKPYMTSGQVLDLARAGFEFGSHSHSHPYFHEIPVEDQKKQIARSVAFIRDLGLQCRSFAFPFHDDGVPASIFRYMRDLDILVSFGTSEARRDSIVFSFQRFAIDAENANSGLPTILKGLSVKSLAHRLSRNEVIHRN